MKLLKHLVLAAACLMLALPASAKDLFPELSENEDLEIIYVSKSMIANSNVSNSLLNSNLSLWRYYDIDDLYMYSSETEEGAEAIDKAIKNFLEKHKDAEVLTKRRTAKGSETMYGIPSKDGKGGHSAIIMLSTSKISDNSSMVVITGGLYFHEDR